MEKCKNESDKVSQQNDSIKTEQANLNTQLEERNQEIAVLREINSNLEDKTNLQDVEVGKDNG